MTQSPLTRSDFRILIVEDHNLFAESLDLALTVEGYEVRRVPIPEVGTTPGALLAQITRLRPRVVLLDLDLGRFGDGVRLVGPIARSGANVVVMTGSTDRSRWGNAVRHGARKVLSKTRPLNDILATVRRLHHGLPVMDSVERESLVAAWQEDHLRNQETSARLDQLTAREREVLAHLMRGHTVRDIAGISIVSEATVRTQVKSILAKLEVSSQLAAVGMANNIGWRPPLVDAS